MFDMFDRRRSGWFITFIEELATVDELAPVEEDGAAVEFVFAIVEFCTGILGFDIMKSFLKDCKIQSRCLSMIELRIKICLYEEKIWEEKNRVTEREREREREERREMIFYFLNTINWDYNHIYNAIA